MTSPLARRVERLDAMLAAHAGGLRLAGLSAEGTVSVAFTGMCTGCPMRPATAAATVRPALLSVEGVARVEVDGGRISEHAEARLAAAFVTLPACIEGSPLNGKDGS